MINTQMGESPPIKKCILLDDDPVFCTLLVEWGRKVGIDIEFYNSVLEIDLSESTSHYDIAIVDFDLGQINGFEVANSLHVFFGDIPLILISAFDVPKKGVGNWPKSVSTFIPKNSGPNAIFNAVSSLRNHQ